MLICVFPLSMLFFFILFNILTLHDSKKYAIEDNKDTSPKPVFPNMHIYRIGETRPDQIYRICRPARRYLALQCIEVQCKAPLPIELQCIEVLCIALLSLALLCIASQSLALLCIELQCIPFLCITAQCITVLAIPKPAKKDPNFFANVRTRLQTDFIDFLGFRCVFFPGPFCALSELYE